MEISKHRVFNEEKLHEIRARFEHAPWKSLRCLAKETGISKLSAQTATKFLKLKPCRTRTALNATT